MHTHCTQWNLPSRKKTAVVNLLAASYPRSTAPPRKKRCLLPLWARDVWSLSPWLPVSECLPEPWVCQPPFLDNEVQAAKWQFSNQGAENVELALSWNLSLGHPTLTPPHFPSHSPLSPRTACISAEGNERKLAPKVSLGVSAQN